MGISDRDYYRDSYHRPKINIGSPWTPVVKWLIIVNLVVWVLQILTVRDGPQGPQSLLTNWLAVDGQLILQGQVWRVVTGAFCHSVFDVMHLLFNMLLLYWFGCRIERRFGSREFLYVYLVAAMVSSLLFIGIDLASGLNARAVGASGAVCAVLMIFAWIWPREKIYLFLVLPVEVRWVVGLYLVFDLHPVLLQLIGQPVTDGVAHAAHVGGLAFGALYMWRNLRLESYLGSLGGLFKTREDKRVVAVKRERKQAGKRVEVKQRVDELLDKVGRDGIGSLSDEERDFLLKASKGYGGE